MDVNEEVDWKPYHSVWLLLNILIFVYGLIVLLYVKCCNSKNLYNLNVIIYHIIDLYYY